MAGRTIAIGDIHGCPEALDGLLDTIAINRDDTIVALGDYIDRGPNSQGVLDRLIRLAERCHFVAIMGNHEEAAIQALETPGDKEALRRWLNLGGSDTLRSFGWAPGGPRRALSEWIPKTHRDFLANCQSFHETPTHLFVHAGYVPDLPLNQQPPLALRWRVTDAATSTPHHSGKIAIVGHTPQHSGEILDLGFRVCIDTNCVRGGWLTAMEVSTGQVWQVSRAGQLRIRDV